MMKRNLLVIGMALMLSACGFHLRGTQQTELALKEINVSARDAYGETVRMVREAMETNGVKVYAGAPYRMIIVREQENRRAASYSSNARGVEYQLNLRADYEIRGMNNLLLTTGWADVQSYYNQDDNNLTGSDQEEALVRNEMRRNLVQQLVQQVGQISPTQLDQMQQDAEARARAEAEALEAASRRRAAEPMQSPIIQPSFE